MNCVHILSTHYIKNIKYDEVERKFFLPDIFMFAAALGWPIIMYECVVLLHQHFTPL